MNKSLVSIMLFVFCLTTLLYSQKPDTSVVFNEVEQMPQFPGGTKKLSEYIGKKLTFPDSLRKIENMGVVEVSFVVSATGKIQDVKVISGIEKMPLFSNIAIDLIKSMPDFLPGKQNGYPVKVRMNLPINFSLSRAPSFSQGDESLNTFISNNLIVPDKVKEGKVSGIVMVLFTVEEDGSLNDIEIAQSLNAECDKAALKLVEAMRSGYWNPALNEKGNSFAQEFILPVVFDKP